MSAELQSSAAPTHSIFVVIISKLFLASLGLAIGLAAGLFIGLFTGLIPISC